MPSGGAGRGQGRKPAPDQSKVKKKQFAGQRWTAEQVECWTAYRNAHKLSVREFEERAFDNLVNSQAVQQIVAPEQNRPA
jgi:hypothetical protein